MQTIELTLAERGQIVIPKEARDALGLKPGARLQLRIEDGRLLIEKKVQLDLSKWVGHAVDDGLSTIQALAELRGRPVPWQADDAKTMATKTKRAKSGTAGTSKAKLAPK
jgi:AbrB family looped-hinge helix DNA binding protein